MTLSAWSVIKNESQFIGYGVMSILPYVDEIVYFDGGSTDGTLSLLDYIKDQYDKENKIKVFKDNDFKDFKQDYVRVFDECLKTCKGDYVLYVHPDMILVEPGNLGNLDKNVLAYTVGMRSFAGEDMDLEITKGRTDKWKTIMRNKFGLHYHGWYGAVDEDMYFDFQPHRLLPPNEYPFKVEDSGAKFWHFCECKPRKRREEKMFRVVTTSGPLADHGRTTKADVHVWDTIMNHPRVHLQTQTGPFGAFAFEPRTDPLPDVFARYKEEFDRVLGIQV
jgi:hypothetical protein